MNLSPEKEQGRQVIYVQSETPIVVAHHSYSSVTTPIEKQILTKGLGFKDPMGAGAHRGQAVETGVVQGLLDHNASVESCIKLAEKKYQLATMMEPLTAADVQRNRSVIAPMVEALIKELRPYGIPEMGVDGQKKITINLDGVKRPIIGFLDLFYPAHGLIVDIKTTLRMPPKITDSHGLQGAIYSHGVGGNYEVRFVYATDKNVWPTDKTTCGRNWKNFGSAPFTVSICSTCIRPGKNWPRSSLPITTAFICLAQKCARRERLSGAIKRGNE